MAKKNGKRVKLGALLENKKGGLYIKLEEGIKAVHIEAEDYQGNDISGTLEAGEDGTIFLNAQTPEENLEFLLENGYIDQKTFDKRLKSTPEFVQLEISTRVV